MTEAEFEANRGKPAPVRECCTALVKRDPDAHLGAVEHGIPDYDFVTPDPWGQFADRDHFGFPISKSGFRLAGFRKQ